MEAIPPTLDEQMLLLWRQIVTNLYIVLNFTRIPSLRHDGTTIDVPVGGLPFVDDDDDEEGEGEERQWEP